MEDKSTPLLDAANKKLEDPSIDCSTMSDADALTIKKKDENAGPSYWYPLHDGSNSCTDDGNQPSYYKLSDLFDNEKVSRPRLCTSLIESVRSHFPTFDSK